MTLAMPLDKYWDETVMIVHTRVKIEHFFIAKKIKYEDAGKLDSMNGRPPVQSLQVAYQQNFQ